MYTLTQSICQLSANFLKLTYYKSIILQYKTKKNFKETKRIAG